MKKKLYTQYMKASYYTVVFHAEPDGGYTAVVPSLPGCVTWGKDLPESKRMAADAIAAYTASMRKHKQTLPIDNVFIGTVPLDPRQTAYA